MCYIDEFLGYSRTTKPIEKIAAQKVSILYQLGILKSNDSRTDRVLALLNKCTSEYQMTRMLHDVVVGNKDLDALLIERGI